MLSAPASSISVASPARREAITYPFSPGWLGPTLTSPACAAASIMGLLSRVPMMMRSAASLAWPACVISGASPPSFTT